MEKEAFAVQDSFGYHFSSIALIIKRLMESELKPYNLTYLQFSILMNLYRNNATTQKEILKYTYGDEAGITRLIDRLESKGYLQRVPSAEDKRKKQLVLTEEGTALAKNMIACAKEVNRQIIEDLPKEEADTLLVLLQKVHGSLKEH